MKRHRSFSPAVHPLTCLPVPTVITRLAVLAVILSSCAGSTKLAEMPADKVTIQAESGVETTITAEMAPVRPDSPVPATGRLMPTIWADLGAKRAGTVVEVLVEPGDRISAGTPLVRLDATEQILALQIAQEEVVALQATLNQLINGASDQVVARAEKENAHKVAQAEIVLEAKRYQLEQGRLQDPAKGVDAAQARVRQLELQLAQARAQDPTPKVTVAEAEMEHANILLGDAQDEYNKALDRPWKDQWIRDAWARQLELAQLNSQGAQAQLDLALNEQSAHSITLAVLTVELEEAQIKLAQTMDAQKAYSRTLDILDTEVGEAQLELEYLRAWENPYLDEVSDDEIAKVTARLRQAELAVAQGELQIQNTEVRAPFDGTVTAILTRVGGLVAAGQSLAILADLTTLRVETTDLDEIDVARVKVDQRVTVIFDAFPDQTFAGRVVRTPLMIDPDTESDYYTAIIELEDPDPALRWGMTALVTIEMEE